MIFWPKWPSMKARTVVLLTKPDFDNKSVYVEYKRQLISGSPTMSQAYHSA